jgi:hypothetical protein
LRKLAKTCKMFKKHDYVNIIIINWYHIRYISIRVPQIQIKSNIGSIWIWSNQIDPDLNLIWFKYLNLNLIWIWIFNSNFQIKSNICQIKSNLTIFEFDQIKYSQIWIWIWSNIWFKYLKIKSNCGTLQPINILLNMSKFF